MLKITFFKSIKAILFSSVIQMTKEYHLPTDCRWLNDGEKIIELHDGGVERFGGRRPVGMLVGANY